MNDPHDSWCFYCQWRRGMHDTACPELDSSKLARWREGYNEGRMQGRPSLATFGPYYLGWLTGRRVHLGMFGGSIIEETHLMESIAHGSAEDPRITRHGL